MPGATRGWMRRRWSRWLGLESGEAGTFFLDPDHPKSQAGKRFIVFVACCEAFVLLGACLFGLWIFLGVE